MIKYENYVEQLPIKILNLLLMNLRKDIMEQRHNINNIIRSGRKQMKSKIMEKKRNYSNCISNHNNSDTNIS